MRGNVYAIRRVGGDLALGQIVPPSPYPPPFPPKRTPPSPLRIPPPNTPSQETRPAQVLSVMYYLLFTTYYLPVRRCKVTPRGESKELFIKQPDHKVSVLGVSLNSDFLSRSHAPQAGRFELPPPRWERTLGWLSLLGSLVYLPPPLKNKDGNTQKKNLSAYQMTEPEWAPDR